ncbi:exosortase U [Rubripirellula sp.]|nr:exosortase U [Rubripirellula sp.]
MGVASVFSGGFRTHFDPRNYILGFVVFAAHLPLLLRLADRMWRAEHYQFFPLILVGAAFIAYQRWPRDTSLERPKSRIATAGLLFASILCLATAVLTDSPWLAAVSAMANLWTFAYLLGGKSLLSALLPAWVFLWLAVPLPLGIDNELIQGLQRLATQWASGLLDLLGYRHLIAGVVLELPGKSFEVEEACSGIHSLFAAMGCTAFYLILMQRGYLRIASLCLATVFWVFVVNTARVTAITALCTQWDLPIATGLGHDLVGVLAFSISLLLIASTERFILLFFPYPFRWREYFNPAIPPRQRKSWLLPRSKTKTAPRDASRVETKPVVQPPAQGASQGTAVQPASSGWIEYASLVFVVAGIGLGQFALAGALGVEKATAQPLSQLNEASEETLPPSISGWKRTSFETITRDPDDINGQISHRWFFQDGERTAVISFDGPFVGWHNLGNCLLGQGWAIDESNSRDLLVTDNFNSVEMKVQKGLAKHALVLYAVFDGQNQAAKPVENYASFRAIRRLPKLAALLNKFSGGSKTYARPDSSTFQIQLFCEMPQPASQTEAQKLTELFTTVLNVATQRPPTDFPQ